MPLFPGADCAATTPLVLPHRRHEPPKVARGRARPFGPSVPPNAVRPSWKRVPGMFLEWARADQRSATVQHRSIREPLGPACDGPALGIGPGSYACSRDPTLAIPGSAGSSVVMGRPTGTLRRFPGAAAPVGKDSCRSGTRDVPPAPDRHFGARLAADARARRQDRPVVGGDPPAHPTRCGSTSVHRRPRGDRSDLPGGGLR